MKCPVCKDVTLQISTRQNIEIDFCPECRGIWLDRGELDKIIERSEVEMQQPMQAQQAAPQQPQYQQQAPQYQQQYQTPPPQYQNQQQQGYYHKHSKQHKVRSFLSDLFD